MMTLSDNEIDMSECPKCELSLPCKEVYSIDDVRHFIKLVKDKIVSNTPSITMKDNWYCNRIDELAGKRLLEGEL